MDILVIETGSATRTHLQNKTQKTRNDPKPVKMFSLVGAAQIEYCSKTRLLTD